MTDNHMDGSNLGDAQFALDPESAKTHALVMQYHRAWRERNLDTLLALFHRDVEYFDYRQNRQVAPEELRGFLAESMPRDADEMQRYVDRLRVDGDTALLQYEVTLRGSSGLVSLRATEVLTVRDGLIARVSEHASLVGKTGIFPKKHQPVGRLGLSARQLGMLGRDIQQYFQLDRAFLNPDLDMQQVAAATGYTRNQLSFFLNQVLGVNFYRYVNQLRLDYLTETLESTSELSSVDALARAAGFRSLSTFYRCFREELGKTPHEYIACRRSAAESLRAR